MRPDQRPVLLPQKFTMMAFPARPVDARSDDRTDRTPPETRVDPRPGKLKLGGGRRVLHRRRMLNPYPSYVKLYGMSLGDS